MSHPKIDFWMKGSKVGDACQKLNFQVIRRSIRYFMVVHSRSSRWIGPYKWMTIWQLWRNVAMQTKYINLLALAHGFTPILLWSKKLSKLLHTHDDGTIFMMWWHALHAALLTPIDDTNFARTRIAHPNDNLPST